MSNKNGYLNRKKTSSNRTNHALLAFTAAATALPGVAPQAQQIADAVEIGYRYHSYEEDPIDQDKVLGIATDRYDIDVNQFRLVAPLNDNFQLDVDYQREKMSGASPWYTFKLGDEAPVQIMSGASIEDTRTDFAAKLSYFWERQVAGIKIARSNEDDYDSLAIGLDYTYETEDRLNTFTLATDVSNDDINPVDADLFPQRPTTEQSKRSNSVLLSYARVLNTNMVAKFSLGYSEKTGYLSDPYKLAFVNFALLNDNRPNSRYTRTFSAQLRYFSDTLNGALHADYRYYNDSWNINSNTIELAWYQNLGHGFQLTPSVRLYDQSDAFFYEVFYEQERNDGLYSTDYRLSEYGAITYGLTLTKSFGHWSLSLSAEQYRSGGNKGLASADTENPALLDFDLYSVGVNYRF